MPDALSPPLPSPLPPSPPPPPGSDGHNFDERAFSAPEPRGVRRSEQQTAAARGTSSEERLTWEAEQSLQPVSFRHETLVQSAVATGRHGRRRQQPYAGSAAYSEEASYSGEESDSANDDNDDAASVASIGDVEYAAMLESLQEHLGAVAGALHEALVVSAPPGTRASLGPRPCTPPAERRARRRSKDRTFDAPMLQPTEHHNAEFEKELRRRREAARKAEREAQVARDGSGRSGRGSAKSRPLVRSEEHADEILAQMAAIRGTMREDYAKALKAKVTRQRKEKRERERRLEKERKEEYDKWMRLAAEHASETEVRSAPKTDVEFLKRVPKSKFYYEVAAAHEEQEQPQPSRRERIQAYEAQLRTNPPPAPARLPPLRKEPVPADKPAVVVVAQEKKRPAAPKAAGSSSSWALTGEPDAEDTADADAHNAKDARGWLTRPKNHVSQSMYPSVLPTSVDGEPVGATEAGTKPLAEFQAKRQSMRERAARIRQTNSSGAASVKALARDDEGWDGTPAEAQPKAVAREALGAKRDGVRDAGRRRQRAAAAAEAARTISLTEVAAPSAGEAARRGPARSTPSPTGRRRRQQQQQQQLLQTPPLKASSSAAHRSQSKEKKGSSLGTASEAARAEPTALTMADAESSHPTRSAKARVWAAQASA